MSTKHTLSFVVIAAALLAAPAFAQSNSSSRNSSGDNSSADKQGSSGSPMGGLDSQDGLNDKSTHTRSPMLSFWGFLPYSYGLGIGVGARYTLPIVPDGFIEGVNDSVELELGADVAFVTYGLYNTVDIIIPVEGRWTFHFTPALSAYGKLAISYDLVPYNSLYTGGGLAGGLRFNFAIGGLYKLNDKMSLRGEIGYGGLKVGLGFDL